MVTLQESMLSGRPVPGRSIAAFPRPVLFLLAALLLVTGVDGIVTGTAPPAAIATPVQAWGSAAGLPHLQGTTRNTREPVTLRARYPLTAPGGTARVPSNTATVVPAPPARNATPGFGAAAGREPPGERDAYSRTSANADGTLTSEFSASPINYRRVDGSWVPIDTRLAPVRGRDGGGWRNTADAVDVRLAPRAGAAGMVRLALDAGHEVAYGVRDGEAAPGEAGARGVTYPRVWRDADVRVDVVPGGVKETVVLHSPSAPASFDFPLALKGLTAATVDGQVVFTDEAGRRRAAVPAGSMADSAARPATSAKVSYSLRAEGGRPVLRVSADPAWLAAPGRVFPVMVDPSVEISAAGTSLSAGDGGSTGGGQELTVGRRSAAYLAFPQLDDRLRNHQVFAAYLWMVNYDSATCRARPVTVHPVTEEWAGRGGLSYPGPGVGPALARSSFSHGYIAFGATRSNCPTKAVTFNLGKGGRDLVQRWADGRRPNYGLSVRDASADGQGYKKFTGHDTANPPRLIVTHSPYNASYAITRPVPEPPVTQAQSGKIKITVTNTGAQTWTPGDYYLAYRVYTGKGKLVTQQRSANLTQNVARGAKVALEATIKALRPGTYSIDFTMARRGGPVFVDENVPPARLILKVIDIPPVLQELYPPNGHQAPALTPQLWATAVDLDPPAGSALSYKFEVCESTPAGGTTGCFDSGYVATRAWAVPAGRLSWGRTYVWRVFVKDTGSEVPSPRLTLLTSVPQPEITSRLAGADTGPEFDPQSGNVGTHVLDAAVFTAGPALNVDRTYNSLDPRRDGAFGAGWSTVYDMRLTQDQDGSGNVVIGYPDGRQVRYGKNPDGTFAPPPGRYATFRFDSAGGKLTDKSGTTYEFAGSRLAKITDANGHAVVLTYNAADGRLATATSRPGERSLTFTWSGAHVTGVGTGPIAGRVPTWTYAYDGDLLTKACAPAGQCTTYEYTPGSHYRSAVLDSGPESYYRLGEDESGSAASQIAVNLGKDAATYRDVTLPAAGAVTGTGDTAAGFNGTSSSLTLPPGAIKRSHEPAVELWFKNLPTGSGGPLLGYQDKPLDAASGTGVPILYVGTDGRLRGQFAGGGAISPITSAAAVNDGRWHHAVLSASGSTQTLYLDGKVAGTLTGRIPDHLALTYGQAGAAYATTPASWPGWGTTPRRHYAGTIDEVALYLHPLGPESVAAHYREALRAADQLAKVTLPSGKVAAEAAYDVARDRVAEYTDGNGGTWRIGPPAVYGGDDDIRRAVEVRDPADQPYLYEYDALAGRVVRQGIPLGLGARDDDVLVTPAPAPSPTFTCTAPDPGDPGFCTTLPGEPGEAPDFIRHNLDGMAIRTFDYDDQGYPSAITDENGDTVRFTYDKRGNPTTRTTCRAADDCHTSYYTYPAVTVPTDPRGDRPVEVRDGRSSGPADNRYRTSFAYGTAGNLLTRTFPDGGGQIRYTYTNGTEGAAGGGTVPSGLPLTETDPRGAVTRYAYTSTGDLAQVTAPSGLVTKYTTDALGRLTSRTEISDSVPAGVTTSYGYDDRSDLTSVTYPAAVNAVTGATTRRRVDNTYDADGNLVRWQSADVASGGEPRTISYDYDDHNHVERATDSLGGETAYRYDLLGNATVVVDPAGTRYEYAYTARNQLAEARLLDADGDLGASGGGTLVLGSYAYDHAGRPVSRTDAMGRRVETAYYGDGLVKSTTLKGFHDPGGSVRDLVLSSIQYDGDGNPVKETTGDGARVTEYTVDAMGRVASATADPAGLRRRTAYQYDLGGNVTQVSSSGSPSNVPWPMPAAPETTGYGYDAAGRMVSESVTDGVTTLTTSYAYDQRDLMTAATDPRGNVAGADKAAYTTTFDHDPLGRQTSVTGPPVRAESDGGPPATVRPRTLTGYNAFGEATELKDALGNVDRVEYDPLGQPVRLLSPSYTPPGSATPIVPVTGVRYDPTGDIEEITDPLGNATRYDHDRLGRLRAQDSPGGDGERAVWRYTYTTTGEVLSAIGPTGARTESTYDDLARPVTTTEVERHPVAAARTTRYTYDDAGDLLSVTTPGGATTTHAYDGTGEPVRTTDPAGVVTRFGYDQRGRLVRESDGLGRTVRHGYHPLGHLAAETDLDAAGTELRGRAYAYDPAGNLTGVTDALGRTTTFAYDAGGRIVEQAEPVSDGTSITTSFGYDAAGNRTRVTNGRGNATIYTTNSLRLPESIIEPATAAHPAAADRTWTTAYDAAGNPVRESAPGGVVRQRVFDAAHRLVKETGSGAATSERTLGYDLAGRLTRAASGTAADVYGYDDRGLLLSAQGPSGTASLAYDADGRLTSRTDAAGTSTFTYLDGRLRTARDGITGTTRTYAYDAAGRPQSVGYGTQATRRFGYDELGRAASDTLTDGAGRTVTSAAYTYDKEDHTTGEVTTGFAGAGSDAYGYDQAGRLTSWTHEGTTTRYTWDAAGNRTGADGATATFDERDRRLTDGGTTYAYTPRGTLAATSGPQGRRAYEFDAFDRMTVAGATAYTYDGLDRPATRDGARMTYSGQGDAPVGDGTFRYARGPAEEALAYGQGSAGRVALADKHGDQVGGFAPGTSLTGLDDSAAYDPFGRLTASRGARSGLGFQGEWTDPGTGHVIMGARWYDPQTGAFDSRDGLTLDPVPASTGANRYTYAGGGPLDGADPSGHAACSIHSLGGSDCLSRLLAALRSCPSNKQFADLYTWYYYSGGMGVLGLPPIGDWFDGGSGGSGGSGGGSGGAGGTGVGGGSGPTQAEREAAARARAIAAARARTAAAKRRAEQDATRNARTIDDGLRRPRYADPRQHISDGIRHPATVTSGTRDVVDDTTRTLWQMRDGAVRDAGQVVHPSTPAAVAPPEAMPVTVPGVAEPSVSAPVKVRTSEPQPVSDAQGGGARPPGSLRVAGDMCDDDEILTSVGCEDPLDTLQRVVNDIRDRFVRNPDEIRRYLKPGEIRAAREPGQSWLGRPNVGKAVERAAARHPDVAQHFHVIGGGKMPDFVALRTMRMYEVTTNSTSAFFNHVGRSYVDPRAYVQYQQVPYGTGLLPRLPQPGMVEPKIPFLKGGP
ncbi:RHS repeat-associated core domain-containing protein [Sphaerisporangium aureirubrum]|uniref:RHS repeat-associated core domain-containing protein n=1 Tax=Sphaerisporangium aureirubrum TaxID=1544736 RepID=A0ABW1N9F7_9ACTN